MRRLLILLPLLACSSAQACLNDRDSDSLAIQANQFPDTLRVVTGRFERNPPLFYEMRIQRSLVQLQKNPRDFGLYDDIGVAFDKLHRSDEALQIMAKKRALLPPFDAKNPKLKEAWYRYYANTGTFHAHRFMGQKTADLSEMKLGRAMIRRAIEIKPNAHFGREKYQLMAMDWILATRANKTELSLSDWIHNKQESQQREVTKGLSGLVVLGAAWQSVDVFDALAYSLRTKEGLTLSHLGYLRAQELLRDGRKSLAPTIVNDATVAFRLIDSPNDHSEGAINPENQKTLAKLFPKLRAEADEWSGARLKYMLARLETGSHPDTDAKFWAAWKPAAPPSLEVDWIDGRKPSGGLIGSLNGLAILGFGTLVSLATLFWVGRRTFKRRRAAI